MMAGSWTPLHQFFDGLNTAEDVPMVAVKPLAEVNFEEINVGIYHLKSGTPGNRIL